jgi:hypothetical protein
MTLFYQKTCRRVNTIRRVYASPRVGAGGLASADFSYLLDQASHKHQESSFRRDTETSTRDMFAPQNRDASSRELAGVWSHIR